MPKCVDLEYVFIVFKVFRGKNGLCGQTVAYNVTAPHPLKAQEVEVGCVLLVQMMGENRMVNALEMQMK